MQAVVTEIRYREMPAIGKGTREAEDELEVWLDAVHDARRWAGKVRDYDGHEFFLSLYNAIAGT